jgi:hypothetical protein
MDHIPDELADPRWRRIYVMVALYTLAVILLLALFTEIFTV